MSDDFQALRKALREVAAAEAGVTLGQLNESFERLAMIQAQGGFGVVSWVIKRGKIYKIDHTVHGKPTVFRLADGDLEDV